MSAEIVAGLIRARSARKVNEHGDFERARCSSGAPSRCWSMLARSWTEVDPETAVIVALFRSVAALSAHVAESLSPAFRLAPNAFILLADSN